MARLRKPRWLRPGTHVVWDEGDERRTGIVVELVADPWSDRAVPAATPPTVPGRAAVAHVTISATNEDVWVPMALLRRQRKSSM